MKRHVIGWSIVLALSVSFAHADGQARRYTFFTEALDAERAALVYLPEGYDTSGLDYPVVYFLQGADGGVNNWYLTDFLPILDGMISEGLIDPVIIVEPDSVTCPVPPEWAAQGMSGRMYCSHTNSALLGRQEDFLAEDLVAWVDTTFKTIADRDHRWLLGRSMGGHGAIRLIMRHPEVFGAASIDAGFMAMVEGMVPDLMLSALASETPGPPYEFAPTNGWNSEQLFSICAAYTPNMTNPPWYVDFLLKEDGTIDEDVQERLLAQSPPALVHAFDGSEYPVDLLLRIGDNDQFGDTFWPVIDALESEGIPFELRTFQGDHWVPSLIERLKVHLTYLTPIKATVEVGASLADPRVLPNALQITIELPGDLDVADIDPDSLVITDVDGRRLDRVIHNRAVSEISDVNGNGRPDLTLEFPCSMFVGAAVKCGRCSGDLVSLTIRGELAAGRFFEATGSVTIVAEGFAVD